MKKLYLAALTCVISTVHLDAQTKFSDIPKIGDVYTMHNFDASGVTISSVGEDQVWDYSNLINTDTFDISVVDPKNEPEGNNFTDADIAVVKYFIGASRISAYNTHYYKTESSTLTKLGRVDKVQPTGGSIIYINKFTDDEVHMKLPLEFGSKNTDAWNTSYTAGGLGLITWSAGQNAYEVEATGTLKLPGKTMNVIRVKRTRKYIRIRGASSGVVERVIYEWYVPTIPFPVLAIEENINSGGGANYFVGYIMAEEEYKDVVGVEKEPEEKPSSEEYHSRNNSLEIYPNPATDNVRILVGNNEKIKLLSVVEVGGKEMIRNPSLELERENELVLNLDGFQPGFYYLKVITENNMEYTKKLILNPM